MDSRTIWTFGMTGVFIGIPMAVLFAVMWWLALRRVSLGSRLQPAAGILRHVDVERKRGAKGSSYFVILCRYDYEVAGRPLTGTRAALEFNSYTSEAQARAKLAGMEVGQPVTVWYDPGRPETAVLEKSAPGGVALFRWLTFGSVAVAVVGGAAAFLTMDSV